MRRLPHRPRGPLALGGTDGRAHHQDMATTVFPQPITRPTMARPNATTIAPAQAVQATRPNYVAIYASSVLAMTALFFIGVAVPCAMFLEGWKIGVGVGAMFAFWGGPSFGVMLGAARVSMWFEANHIEM